VSNGWWENNLDLSKGLRAMPRWTSESRLKQAQKIRQWQPWQKSTGPTTPKGKAISSKNRNPSDFFVFHGVQIRADTKGGQRLVHELMEALAKHRLKLISDEQCWQRIEDFLGKNGYLETE
jgi:hypothetical protein